MITQEFNFRKAFRYLPQITLIGIGIGTANYVMHLNLNWIQWTLQSLATSFIIGYTLITVASNKHYLKAYLKSNWKLYLLLFIVCFLAAAFATEIEQLIKSSVFQDKKFILLSAGKMYLFNGIISFVLGICFMQYDFSKKERSKSINNQKKEKINNEASKETIINVPVKQGENILFVPIQNIVYFEAYDNYSFVHDTLGDKKLCDYSLLFLEKKLSNQFSRIHRKYIVNKKHIKLIKPHINGRYLIQFDTHKLTPITSSKSYSATIRSLIKIN